MIFRRPPALAPKLVIIFSARALQETYRNSDIYENLPWLELESVQPKSIDSRIEPSFPLSCTLTSSSKSMICSLSLKALNIYESSTERELHQLSFSTLSCSFIMYYYFSQQHRRVYKQEEDGENGEGVDDKKEKFQKCTENSLRFFDSCPRVGVENSKLSRSTLYRFRFSYNFSLLAFIHRFNLDFKGMFFQ